MNMMENVQAEKNFNDRFIIAELFDCYGNLLAKRQQQCLTSYINDDLTISETGELLEISRQAVFDTLKRARAVMEDYEKQLGLVKERQSKKAKLAAIYERLAAFDGLDDDYKNALNDLKNFIEDF